MWGGEPLKELPYGFAEKYDLEEGRYIASITRIETFNKYQRREDVEGYARGLMEQALKIRGLSIEEANIRVRVEQLPDMRLR